MSFAGKLEHESSVANILSEADILASVTTLRRVCESCVGPHGKCHLIHNNVGGHVVVTSAVERLFSASQVSCPALRLLISAVQHHSSMHSDGAATTATLSLLMTERALSMSAEQKRSLVVDLFDVVTEAATSYLTSDQCPVRRPLQLDNLHDLQQLLRGLSHSFVVSSAMMLFKIDFEIRSFFLESNAELRGQFWVSVSPCHN